MFVRQARGLFLLLVLILVQFHALSQPAKKKSIVAIRINEPPKIDAVLDDAAWALAKPATDFVQLKPYNGNPSSFNSEVKFVYDDNALYVGAMLYDPHPDSIDTELSERDDLGIVDYFGVYLDCFNDYLTSFGFVVTAVGVQVDVKSTYDDDDDETWDAVWKSEVNITDDGWVVEMLIPYSALRFPKKEDQLWSLQISRQIMRYKENSTWNFINREQDGFNNQAGELHGIKNINPPLRLSFVPYVSGYVEKSPETKKWGYSYNYGLDLKLGLSESYTLDMTLVPDFGQVQSDDQIYNLSPFEVYYDEKRPFFMEGTELFEKGDIFYTRRIGDTPLGYYSVEDSLSDSEIIKDNPQNVQLINATKISGKSKHNLATGFFNAITTNTWAEVADTVNGSTRKVLTEPFTNYNMLVFDQALKNNSFVSLFNTNTTKPDVRYSANVTGSEFKLTNKKNKYAVWMQGIISQKYTTGLEPDFGYRYSAAFGKISGNFTWEFGHNVIDDKYDPNDMGFLPHNNLFEQEIELSYNIYKPTWKILEWHNSLWIGYSHLYNPRSFTDFDIGFNSFTTTKKHLSLWLNGNFSPVYSYDYYEPRLEGRYFKTPPYFNASIGLSPDYRKRFLADWRIGYFTAPQFDEYSYWFSIEPRFRVSDKLMLIYEFSYKYDYNDYGYVSDSLNDQNVDVIIFGSRNIDTYENTFNANFRFTNKSSLSLRLRHYWINLHYTDYYDLTLDGTLAPSEYNEPNDFSFNVFNIDMQYIWNFAPGSEIRVVWKNAIDKYDEADLVNSILKPVDDGFGRNFMSTIQTPANNSFSIKVLYYIDYQNIRKAFQKKPD